MDKFTQFKQEVEKLHHFLQDEQSGLFSWNQLLSEKMENINTLYYGKSRVELNSNISSNHDDKNDYKVENGDKVWRNKEGLRHRDNDLPAIIYTNGREEYWINGNKKK